MPSCVRRFRLAGLLLAATACASTPPTPLSDTGRESSQRGESTSQPTAPIDAPPEALSTSPLATTTPPPATTNPDAAVSAVGRSIEYLFGRETPVYVRTPAGCTQWTLTGGFSKDGVGFLELTRRAVDEEQGKHRWRITQVRAYGYKEGFVSDGLSWTRLRERWDAKSSSWEPVEQEGSAIACLERRIPVQFDGRTIVFSDRRWHLDREHCLASQPSRALEAVPDCD